MLAILKKDFMLLKKALLFEVIFCILIVPFLGYRIKDLGILGSFLIYFLIQLVILITTSTSLSTKEVTNEKAISYLCCLPYKRFSFVCEKYAMDIILAVTFSIIYSIEALIFDEVEALSLFAMGGLLIIVFLYRGFFIPLEFKFGFEKVKFYSMFAIFFASFGIPMLMNNFEFSNLSIDFFTNISEFLKVIMVYGIIAMIIIISMLISKRIFERKEL